MDESIKFFAGLDAHKDSIAVDVCGGSKVGQWFRATPCIARAKMARDTGQVVARPDQTRPAQTRSEFRLFHRDPCGDGRCGIGDELHQIVLRESAEAFVAAHQRDRTQDP